VVLATAERAVQDHRTNRRRVKMQLTSGNDGKGKSISTAMKG